MLDQIFLRRRKSSLSTPVCNLSRDNQHNLNNLCKYPAASFVNDKLSFKHIQRVRKSFLNWKREKRWVNVFFFIVYNLTLCCALSFKYCSKVLCIYLITSLNWDVCQLITYNKTSSSVWNKLWMFSHNEATPTCFAIVISDSSIKPSVDLCIWLHILKYRLTNLSH